MKYILYKTGVGERWDTIAYKFFSNSYQIKLIIEANPHIKISSELPAEIEIKIPILEKNNSDKSQLPIWRQYE